MGIFVAWMRAKAMASGAGVAPKGKPKQRGVVIVEWLVFSAAIIAASASMISAYDQFSASFSAMWDSVSALM